LVYRAKNLVGFLLVLRGDKMIKKGLLFLMLLFFLIMTPFQGHTQTLSANRGGEVAIMPFLILDDSVNTTQLYNKMIAEVDNLGIYYTRRVSAIEHPEIIELSPDIPPDMRYLRNSPYALTGEFYMDTEDYQHLQIWLWNSFGRLLYTDEMVSESYEESIEYIPLLVRWIFSHTSPNDFTPPLDTTPRRQTTPAAAVITDNTASRRVRNSSPPVEPEEEKRPMERLYLGLRGGASFNTSTIPHADGTYDSDRNWDISYEAALLAELKVLRFLSFQTEVIFTQWQMFFLKTGQGSGTADPVDTFRAMALSFPLLVKVPIEFGFFDLSLYGGAYLTLPLGRIDVTTGSSVISTAAYKINLPIGFSAGVDLGFLLGPGRLFLDLRYSRNFGMTRIRSASGLQYTKDMIGLTLGYKFILWKQ
jgi:hypothetical protein